MPRRNGFLSENPSFAQIVQEHGLTFIGPKPEHIRVMGDKIEAKKMALQLGIPCVPGSDGAITTKKKEAVLVTGDIGFPVIVKAAAGGRGKGMQIAFSETQLIRSYPVGSVGSCQAAQLDPEKCISNAILRTHVISRSELLAIRVGSMYCI